jgi:hypothetical protein
MQRRIDVVVWRPGHSVIGSALTEANVPVSELQAGDIIVIKDLTIRDMDDLRELIAIFRGSEKRVRMLLLSKESIVHFLVSRLQCTSCYPTEFGETIRTLA